MKKRISELLAKTRNPYEIARATGARLSEIRAIMKAEPSELPGWGRPSLQPHIISRCLAERGYWPAEDADILINHKRLHDQGRVTMCQGRDGRWIIQYAIPMKSPVRRNAYFYGEY